MKLLLIKLPHYYKDSLLLTPNKWYEGDLTPTIYDPQTLQPAPALYIVSCNDGKSRKIEGEYFITQEEWRERKLNELGI